MDDPSVRFCLGKVVATPGALTALQSAGERVESRLARHQSGDFGELDSQDVSEQTRPCSMKTIRTSGSG
jgi:hypothetical protein